MHKYISFDARRHFQICIHFSMHLSIILVYIWIFASYLLLLDIVVQLYSSISSENDFSNLALEWLFMYSLWANVIESILNIWSKTHQLKSCYFASLYARLFMCVRLSHVISVSFPLSSFAVCYEQNEMVFAIKQKKLQSDDKDIGSGSGSDRIRNQPSYCMYMFIVHIQNA